MQSVQLSINYFSRASNYIRYPKQIIHLIFYLLGELESTVADETVVAMETSEAHNGDVADDRPGWLMSIL